MFILKKIVVAFVRPPGIFVALAFALAAALAWRRRWRPALVASLAGLLLWLPALGPVSHALKRGLVTGIPGADTPLTGDVIVVLGGGVADRAVDALGAAGVVSESMARRLITAVQLRGRFHIPIMVTGGTPLGEAVSEARVAARYLADLGVPPGAVIIEERARDTAENARYVADLCRKMGFRRVLLVTSTYHLKRAVMAFADSGLEIRPVGDTGLDVAGRDTRWSDFLPLSYESTAKYIHEYLGMMAYRLAG